MKLPFHILFFLGLVLETTPAFACFTDFDCNQGSYCRKADFSIEGYCQGTGFDKGAPQEDFNAPLDLLPNPWKGKACFSDMECAFGHLCLKDGINIDGVCN